MKILPKEELTRLVEQAMEGDKEAFSALYRATFEAQYFTALSIVKDSGLAEEAVQNAYIKAMLKLPALASPANFLGWINSITYHCCMDAIRKRRVFSAGDALDADTQSRLIEQEAPEGPLDRVLEGERREIVMDAVNELRDPHRTVILLRYFQDMPLKEIAAVMGCSTGTIKSRIHYAHKELRSLLEKKGYTEVNASVAANLLLSQLKRKEPAASKPSDFFQNKYQMIQKAACLCIAAILTTAVCVGAFKTNAGAKPEAAGCYDTTEPELVSYERAEGQLVLHFFDAQSGVDYKTLQITDDAGDSLPPSELNEDTNRIALPYRGRPLTLTISDKAGNYVDYHIDNSIQAYPSCVK